jgi:hypothetical protein
VLVIEFEGEGEVDRHKTSRHGGQQQTDEGQVEVAPNLDLHQRNRSKIGPKRSSSIKRSVSLLARL